MVEIDKLLRDLLNKEGGYVDHPRDKGGPTKYGVTLKTLNAWTLKANTKKDLQKLTEQQACTIYLANYYRGPGINQLPGAAQPILFDMAVNHGPKIAAQLLQSQLLADDYPVGKIDGKIGTKTIAMCQQAVAELGDAFLAQLVNRRIDRYKAIVKNDPTQQCFEDGWIARAESFRPGAIA